MRPSHRGLGCVCWSICGGEGSSFLHHVESEWELVWAACLLLNETLIVFTWSSSGAGFYQQKSHRPS
jgi:hypothetical protein